MKVEAITNNIISIRTILQDEMLRSTGFSIASSFIDEYAIDLLEQALNKNRLLKEVNLLIGVYGCFNRKSALIRLVNLAKKHALILRIHISRNKKFHWKYFYFNQGRKHSIYVGSANFTSGGMGANGEILVKLSDNTSKKDRGFVNILNEFDKEWNLSGSIFQFNLNEYKELQLTKVSIDKSGIGNNNFFEKKISKKFDKQVFSDKVVVAYLVADISRQSAKMIENLQPEWKGGDYFVCNNRRIFEQCCNLKKFLILERESKDLILFSWAQYRNEMEFKTPDGRYFIAYDVVGKSKKLSDKKNSVLSDKNGEWKFNLNGRNNVLHFKIIGKNQVKKMEELLGT